jgi:hypothetical protein
MAQDAETDIEQQLTKALEQAKTAYESAKHECARLRDCATDLGQAHPDGAYAYQQALERLSAATEHYKSSLIVFNRFVIGRKPLL